MRPLCEYCDDYATTLVVRCGHYICEGEFCDVQHGECCDG